MYALVLASVLSIGVIGVAATPAHAATFPVSTEAELVAAINDANANGTSDTITLTASGFALTADLPLITETLAIVGPGSGLFTIDAASFALFASLGSVTNTSFALSGITVQNAALFSINTEDIAVVLSDLVVDSVIQHNRGNFSASDVDVSSAPSTGGLALAASGNDVVNLIRVVVSGTFLEGIGIAAGGDAVVVMTDVTVTGSGTDSYDGINVTVEDAASLEIVNSEFSGNFSDGIQIEAFNNATVTVSDVTADRNEADGIDVNGDDDSSVTIRDSSASENNDRGFESDFAGATGTFENLFAEQNADDGFDIEAELGASIVLTNPVALDNVGGGINAYTDTPDAVLEIDGGRAEGGSEYGLLMNPNTGTVIADGFIAQANDGVGVVIEGFGGEAILRNASVTDNNLVGGTDGGGITVIANEFGDGPLEVTIENSTIDGNAAAFGGGIFGFLGIDSTLAVRNSTISGNQADVGGGMLIEGEPEAEFTLEHSTVTLNETSDLNSAAVIVVGVPTTITHSIIAGNVAPGSVSNLNGTNSLDVSYSLVQTGDASALAALSAGPRNIVGQPAQLGALANNGGPTLTHVPLAGSPAISAGDVGIVGAPATDQRGEDRVVGVIEIGSVELQAPELAATGANESIAALTTGLALVLVLGGSLLLVVRLRRGAMRLMW